MIGLLVFFIALTAAVQGIQCPSQGMSPAARQSVLQRHNALRSSNAFGREQDGPSGRRAPPAKNMYKLEYDCELERIAQNWANRCVFAHNSRSQSKAGENIYYSSPTVQNDSPVTKAVDAWWAELKQIGVSRVSPNFQLTNALFATGVGHYTQMAWARTTRVGCGHAKCPNMNFVVCNYREPGNMLGSQIYEIGAPCKKDSDCTTFPGSRCSAAEGLCIA